MRINLISSKSGSDRVPARGWEGGCGAEGKGPLTPGPPPKQPLSTSTLCNQPSAAQGIGKSFRTGLFGPGKAVLREVDLEVAPGAIFGVLGPNGAGKTTLISILATLLRPDTGQARVLGLDVVREAARLRERINLAASGAHFLWCLTVEENLRFYGRLYGLGGRALTGQGGGTPGLVRAGGPTAGSPSSGCPPASNSAWPWPRP